MKRNKQKSHIVRKNSEFKLKDGECDKNETTLACMMQNYSFKIEQHT
ncbi:type IV secretion system protein VirB6, partial [Wolbachia endosymbiont of Drosophila ananassae]